MWNQPPPPPPPHQHPPQPPKPRSSRSSRHSSASSSAAMSNRSNDVITVATPLPVTPSVTSTSTARRKGGGGRGGGGNRARRNGKGGGGGGGCFMCCTGSSSGRRSSHRDVRREKNKGRRAGSEAERRGQSYPSLVTSDSVHANEGGTVASGITGLSQITDIPRYDSDTEASTTAHPATTTTTTSIISPPTTTATPLPQPPTTTTSTTSTTAKGPEGVSHKGGSCSRCGRYMRKFVRGFFSLLGLTVLVAGYAIGGGFLFAYLEREHEMMIREDVVKRRATAVQILWNTTEELNILHEELWKERANQILDRFQREMHVLIQRGWDGSQAGQRLTSWTLGSSLLYSITVITTIGYGNVTPKTMLGRFSTIGYAIIGIPLCLMWLSSMGGLMASAFRFLYHKMARLCLCLACKAPADKRRRRQQQQQQHNKRRQRTTTRTTTTDHALIMEEGTQPLNNNNNNNNNNDLTPASPTTPTPGAGEKGGGRVRVPLLVSLLVLVSYIVLGAVLFSTWEGWEFSESAYFCFVTLSTIGFGDFVPGFGTDMSQGKAIGNAFYLVLGLALLAMCFDLMREEVTLIFRNIASTISAMTSDTPSSSSSSKASRVKGGRERRGAEKPLLGDDPSKAEVTFTRRPFMVSAPRAASKSMHTLLEAGREPEDPQPPRTLIRGRHYTVSAAAAATSSSSSRYCPMPQTGWETTTPTSTSSTRILPRTFSSSSSSATITNNNNNNSLSNSLNNKTSVEGVGEPPNTPHAVPRSMSVPPQSLTETLDLLEHVSVLSARSSSPPVSAKVLRSRSPVRGRPKSRGAGNVDRGGNVDVATEDEEEEEEDDSNTLDAESLASSTDLVKMSL